MLTELNLSQFGKKKEVHHLLVLFFQSVHIQPENVLEKKKKILNSPRVISRLDCNNMLNPVDSKSFLLKSTFCKAVMRKYIYLW